MHLVNRVQFHQQLIFLAFLYFYNCSQSHSTIITRRCVCVRAKGGGGVGVRGGGEDGGGGGERMEGGYYG